MEHWRRVLSYFRPGYAQRAYIIGAVFFIISLGIMFMGMSANDKTSTGSKIGIIGLMSVLLIVDWIIFPFAKMLWDNTKAMVLGDNFLILPIVFLYPAKFIINGLLFSYAFILGPIGIIWAWYKTRRRTPQNH